MRLAYKSTPYKIFSVLRYFILKVYYFKKVTIRHISMIGKRCGIHILGQGTMRCKGRIIVNDDVMIYSRGKLTIGENFGINSYSRIVTHEAIDIGNNVTIGQMVSILDHDHHFEIENQDMKLSGYDTSPVSIGNNVWIGDKSTILRGVTIGDNVVIGANTLINKNVPSNCVVGGIPFKVLKELDK